MSTIKSSTLKLLKLAYGLLFSILIISGIIYLLVFVHDFIVRLILAGMVVALIISTITLETTLKPVADRNRTHE